MVLYRLEYIEQYLLGLIFLSILNVMFICTFSFDSYQAYILKTYRGFLKYTVILDTYRKLLRHQ